MGGFFGAVSTEDALTDVFFGTDYHSHLGTKSAGMAAYDEASGLQRKIHNIGNAPFRTKFDGILNEMRGNAAIGCINDTDPQPLLVRSKLGRYAICTIGVINNAEELIEQYIETSSGQVGAMSGGGQNATEIVAAFINQKASFAEGIRYVQELVDGTISVLILTEHGSIIAARDRMGRLPVHIGKSPNGYCVSFEHFAYQKLGYKDEYELKPAEIVELTATEMKQLVQGREEMHICAFLWSYYGFPTSCYEGINVEMMRCRNGEIMAENEINAGTLPQVDCVAGVPDSGTPHAIGFANRSHMPFARPFIKYTPTWPRSFMPSTQKERNRIAKMKQIPVDGLINEKELLFVDDSIVRGTQLRETVEFLYESGAKKVHMRSACPPIMYGCKYLNFSRATSDRELITRATILELEGEEGLEHIEEYSNPSTERGRRMREAICEKLHLASLEFQTIDGLIKAIGLEPCKICTYCWNGK
ncbi:MAG TPA: amidophosphoribosyltransferase, partial [Ruminococcaceae bacterium]|nr:amidophosphoribosyltransferase [Oscillospiraceae bacterium]